MLRSEKIPLISSGSRCENIASTKMVNNMGSIHQMHASTRSKVWAGPQSCMLGFPKSQFCCVNSRMLNIPGLLDHYQISQICQEIQNTS